MSRVVAAPVDLVWRTFVDPTRRVAWIGDVMSVTVLEQGGPRTRWLETYRPRPHRATTDEIVELSLVVLEPGRRCSVGLVGRAAAPQRTYCFTPVEVGPQRGSTVVTVIDDRCAGLADRLFDLVAGGFVARTVEGAIRKELDALAAACTVRVIVPAAA
ncbi:MAG TPA: SRPBCC family protein [Micromonosporaceae bacterium]